jgi:ABC-type proline/glycine betaine transport system ATPase subunit
MKNELILAKYTGQKKRSAAERLQALLKEFGLEAMLKHRYPALDVSPV